MRVNDVTMSRIAGATLRIVSAISTCTAVETSCGERASVASSVSFGSDTVWAPADVAVTRRPAASTATRSVVRATRAYRVLRTRLSLDDREMGETAQALARALDRGAQVIGGGRGLGVARRCGVRQRVREVGGGLAGRLEPRDQRDLRGGDADEEALAVRVDPRDGFAPAEIAARGD